MEDIVSDGSADFEDEESCDDVTMGNTEGLTDGQKLFLAQASSTHDHRIVVKPSITAPNVESTAYIRILQSRELYSCAATGLMLIRKGHIEAVVGALVATLPTPVTQDKCWEVLDSIVSCSGEHAAGVVEAVAPHLAELLLSCTAAVNPHRQYHMLGRWWRVFDPSVMSAALQGYAHSAPAVPLTPDEMEHLGVTYAQNSAKRARLVMDDASTEGDRYWDAGDFPRALKEYLRAAEAASQCDSEVATSLLARIAEGHLELSQYGDALRVASILVEVRGNWEGRELQGAVHRALKDYSTAAQHIEEAVAMCPDAYNKVRMRGVLEELRYEVLLRDAPKDVAVRALRLRATDAVVAGELPLAYFCYTRLATADPDALALHRCNRSAVLSRMKRYKDALKDAEEVITLRPEWHHGYLRKGRALQGLKRYDDALVCFFFDKTTCCQF